MGETVIGIDIGGTNFRIACVDRQGNVLNSNKCSSSILIETDDSVRKTADVIAQYISDNSVKDAVAICIGIPGEIAKDGQTIMSMPNLQNGEKGFDGKNLAMPLMHRLNLPVYLNKDANNLLQCDITLRGLQDKGILIGVYFGTGIGNSIYINRSFVTGKHGAATSLGHIPFFKSDKECNCGNIGCSECYASGYYLKELWQKKFSLIEFSDIFRLCLNEPDIIDFIEACAVTVAAEVNILDPDLIIIGGGVAEMEGFPLTMLKERIAEHCKRPYPSLGVEIMESVIKQNAGVVGAAFYAFEMLDRG